MITTCEQFEARRCLSRQYERSVAIKAELSGLMQRAGVSSSLAHRFFDSAPDEDAFIVSASGMELVAEGCKKMLHSLHLNSEQIDLLHTAVVYIRTSHGAPQDHIARVLYSLVNNGIDIGCSQVIELVRTTLPDYVAKISIEDYAIVLQGIVPQGRTDESPEQTKQLVEERIATMLLDRIDAMQGADKFFERLSLETVLRRTVDFGIEEVRYDVAMQNTLGTENKHLRKLLLSDRLLDMPNRSAVDDFVSKMAKSVSTMDAHIPPFADRERLAEYQTVVGFIDLNRFKGFQEANGGHDFGDVYLTSIRDGLLAAANDLFPHGMVWRQSGDEFGFIVPYAVHMSSDIDRYIAELDVAVREYMFSAYIDGVRAGKFESASNKTREVLLELKKLLFPERRYDDMDIRNLLFSIGYSVQFMPSTKPELDDMWKVADEAMFNQKKSLFSGDNSRIIGRRVSARRTIIARALGDATVCTQVDHEQRK